MSATPIEDVIDTSLRAPLKRRRLIITLVIVAVAAAAAFAAWGPVGIGRGPIGNLHGLGFTDEVSRTQPTWFVVPINAGHSGAVIDRIEVRSDGSFPAPRVITIMGDGEQACGGIIPVAGPQNFYALCASGGLFPLLGRPVPVTSHVDVPGMGPVNYRGTAAAVEAAPPGPAGCWIVTKFVIHYHVGTKHYTATDAVSFAGCWSKTQLAGLGD